MKILIVSASDIQGGAARAAYRLHQSLRDQAINCTMLVQNKITDDSNVIGAGNKMEKILYTSNPFLDSIPSLFYKNKTKTLFSTASLSFTSNIVNKINSLNPDIVHLHWINAGMLKFEDLTKINAPIVWSLHDMWAITGGCHYDEHCGGYESFCGQCKVLGSNSKNDLSRYILRKKQKILSKLDSVTIIALSCWLKTSAEKSSLFKNKNIIQLPNPINTDQYQAFDKKLAREILNLPQNKHLVLYGAALFDPRKGYIEFDSAIKKLNSENIELIIFGSSQPNESASHRYKTHFLGHLHDDISLRLLYSSADVLVVPSLQENLSNCIMESLSCSTPVVAFDVGGNKDMIEHQQNGYLAKAFNTSDLTYGIEWVINHKNPQQLCDNARQKVLTSFDSKIVAKQYIDLYNTLL